MLTLLFPQFPLRRVVDPSFQAEWDAATRQGFDCHLVNVEFDGKVDLRDLPKGPALYRGWMLEANGYSKFYNALQAHGTDLYITPKMFSHAHLLPRHYSKIAGHTPPSIWTGVDNATTDEWFEKVEEEFGNNPIIIKSFWKSVKHLWNEACFVPDASDRIKLRDTILKFLAETEAPGGVVFRKYMSLEVLEGGERPGKLPLCKEFRLFYVMNTLAIWGPYWDNDILKHEGAYYDTEEPPFAELNLLAQKIESPFFTMDVAKLSDGGWTIIEIGDGGVSGLQAINPDDFYCALAQGLPS